MEKPWGKARNFLPINNSSLKKKYMKSNIILIGSKACSYKIQCVGIDNFGLHFEYDILVMCWYFTVFVAYQMSNIENNTNRE